jgi:FKBP-type peptidyl-prolyl cis-trans isomerase
MSNKYFKNIRVDMVKISRYIYVAFIAAGLIALLAGCDPANSYEKDEKEAIQNYLDNHPDLNYVLKSSGMYYLDEVVGTGAQAVTHDTAYFFFTGYTISGTKFQSNVGTTDTLIYPVNEGWLIAGFDEALTYMKVGGKAKILLPSALAYLDYNPLLFDIHLVKLKAGPGAGK